VAAAYRNRAKSIGPASLTARANLVAVVSNGTAVLGLAISDRWHRSRDGGRRSPVQRNSPASTSSISRSRRHHRAGGGDRCGAEPTFGGINLEDIKGPECFEIEAQLKERMKIPVFS